MADLVCIGFAGLNIKSFILFQEVFYHLISGLACIGFAGLRDRQLPWSVLLQVCCTNLDFNSSEITVTPVG